MKKFIHPGNIVLAGFSAMVLFMCYLVYQCNQHPSVMVSKNYYEQEMKYQDVIDAERNANTLSEPIQMEKGRGELVFHVPKELNESVTTAHVVVYNRADDTKDRTIQFNRREDGLYSIPLSELTKGNYEMKLSVSTLSKSYYKEFPVVL